MEQFYNPDLIDEMRLEKEVRLDETKDKMNWEHSEAIHTESYLFLLDEAEIIAEQTKQVLAMTK